MYLINKNYFLKLSFLIFSIFTCSFIILHGTERPYEEVFLCDLSVESLADGSPSGSPIESLGSSASTPVSDLESLEGDSVDYKLLFQQASSYCVKKRKRAIAKCVYFSFGDMFEKHEDLDLRGCICQKWSEICKIFEENKENKGKSEKISFACSSIENFGSAVKKKGEYVFLMTLFEALCIILDYLSNKTDDVRTLEYICSLLCDSAHANSVTPSSVIETACALVFLNEKDAFLKDLLRLERNESQENDFKFNTTTSGYAWYYLEVKSPVFLQCLEPSKYKKTQCKVLMQKETCSDILSKIKDEIIARKDRYLIINLVSIVDIVSLKWICDELKNIDIEAQRRIFFIVGLEDEDAKSTKWKLFDWNNFTHMLSAVTKEDYHQLYDQLLRDLSRSLAVIKVLEDKRRKALEFATPSLIGLGLLLQRDPRVNDLCVKMFVKIQDGVLDVDRKMQDYEPLLTRVASGGVTEADPLIKNSFSNLHELLSCCSPAPG
jgi:hypothetical protein